MMNEPQETVAATPKKSVFSKKVWGIAAAVTLGFSLAVNVLWWSMLSPSANPGVTEWVIPEGTAAALASGSAFAFLPNAFSLKEGVKVIVKNRDVVAHEIGDQTIPAKSTATLEGLQDGSFKCSIHPSGALSIDLAARPSIFSTILPTLILGLPLTLMVGFAFGVLGKLESPHTA